MKKIFVLLNLPRTGIIYFVILHCKNKRDILEDLDRFAYDNKKHANRYLTFSEVILFDKCFRNVLDFRLKKSCILYSIILRFLFPLKKDMEIGRCEIKGGLVCYHGHGIVINAEKIGKNLSIWQGVTIGKNINSEQLPIIGDNVSIYTNAVVAGAIRIGDNVKIGAGAVVMKDVPSDSVVIGNPCVIKKR